MVGLECDKRKQIFYERKEHKICRLKYVWTDWFPRSKKISKLSIFFEIIVDHFHETLLKSLKSQIQIKLINLTSAIWLCIRANHWGTSLERIQLKSKWRQPTSCQRNLLYREECPGLKMSKCVDRSLKGFLPYWREDQSIEMNLPADTGTLVMSPNVTNGGYVTAVLNCVKMWNTVRTRQKSIQWIIWDNSRIPDNLPSNKMQAIRRTIHDRLSHGITSAPVK